MVKLKLIRNVKFPGHRLNYHRNQIINREIQILIRQNRNHRHQRVPVQKVNAARDRPAVQRPENQKAGRMISRRVSTNLIK